MLMLAPVSTPTAASAFVLLFLFLQIAASVAVSDEKGSPGCLTVGFLTL